MYAGRINFRFDSSPRLSLIPRRVENNKFPPFSCFGNNNSQEENSAREKISTYICKYFATMLHDSLELAYRGKNSSPFFIESRSQVKKKKEKIPSMYKISKYLVEIKEKKRKPSPPLHRAYQELRVQDYSPRRRRTRAEIYTADPRWKCKWDRQAVPKAGRVAMNCEECFR